MLSEVENIFENRLVSFILSLGAGHTLPPGIDNSSDLGMSLATDRERVAQELAHRFQHTEDLYFRFDVEHGLQNIRFTNWEKMGEVVAHSRRYLREADVDRKIGKAAKAFGDGGVGVPVAQISKPVLLFCIYIMWRSIWTGVAGVIPPVEGVEPLKSCPLPSPMFTGQQHALARIQDFILGESEGRHVFVLHGLGGSGKTQLALQFAHLYGDQYVSFLCFPKNTINYEQIFRPLLH